MYKVLEMSIFVYVSPQTPEGGASMNKLND